MTDMSAGISGGESGKKAPPASPLPTGMRPRVRFAPSPTGFLHVGGARTALFNWLYARKFNGDFLLRIEDTDRQRSTEESTRAIFEGLEWLGLDWDGEVVHQGANVARHFADAHKLLENGSAYRDFTTPEQLDRMRAEAEEKKEPFRFDRSMAEMSEAETAERLARNEPYAIRFRVPEGVTEWDDLVHGNIAFPNKDIEDFVILRSDGTPVYNMAVVSDDLAMGITLVMRGDDHISNTPKQILLYRALGASLPQFAHVPMIHGPDGKKLSKRHGATAVGDYRHEGLLPEAMLNFLALLGWSTGDDTEVMRRDEMVARFRMEGLQKKPAIFDNKKLEWMNGQHLAMIPAEELAAILVPWFERAGLAKRAELESRSEWFCGVLELLKVRARLLGDIVEQAKPFFVERVSYDPDAVTKQWRHPETVANILEAAEAKLRGLTEWSTDDMEAALRALAIELGITGGKIFQPLRVALVGLTVSPGIFDVLRFLGRERSLQRISDAVRYLRNE